MFSMFCSKQISGMFSMFCSKQISGMFSMFCSKHISASISDAEDTKFLEVFSLLLANVQIVRVTFETSYCQLHAAIFHIQQSQKFVPQYFIHFVL